MKFISLIILFFLIFPDTDFRGFTFLRLGSEPDMEYNVSLTPTKRLHYHNHYEDETYRVNFRIGYGLHYDFRLHGFKIYVMHTRLF
jgi:hypothetical protein